VTPVEPGAYPHPHPSTRETRVGVVIPAAGSGRRMGGVRKPFLELAGEPVLLHALRPFLEDPRVVTVVVALAPLEASAPPAWLTTLDPRVVLVTGGAHRGASVSLGLAALPDALDVIVVHDAARPLVTPAVVRDCVDVAASGVGAVAGSPAVDSMKTVDGDGFVVASPDRDTLWHAHTPQAFPAAELVRAYAMADEAATDDATLFCDAGGRVRMVDDGGANLKVTRHSDVALAEAFLEGRERS